MTSGLPTKSPIWIFVGIVIGLTSYLGGLLTKWLLFLFNDVSTYKIIFGTTSLYLFLGFRIITALNSCAVCDVQNSFRLRSIRGDSCLQPPIQIKIRCPMKSPAIAVNKITINSFTLQLNRVIHTLEDTNMD